MSPMSRTSSPHKSKCTCIENNATARRVKNETMMPGRRAKRRTHKHTGRAQQNVRKKVHYRESQKNRSHTHTHTHYTRRTRSSSPLHKMAEVRSGVRAAQLAPDERQAKIVNSNFYHKTSPLVCVCACVSTPLPSPPQAPTWYNGRPLAPPLDSRRACVCVSHTFDLFFSRALHPPNITPLVARDITGGENVRGD